MSKLFGEKLRYALHVNHMTQDQLARKTGVSTRTIQRYIYGESEPNDAILNKISSILRTYPEDLMNVHLKYDKDDDLFEVLGAIRRNRCNWTSEEKQTIIQEIMRKDD